MKYEVTYTSSFKRDLRKALQRNYDIEKLKRVVALLEEGKNLPPCYKDHQLKGNKKDFRELHIENDWLLIYQRKEKILVLTLTRTGTHSDLLE